MFNKFVEQLQDGTAVVRANPLVPEFSRQGERNVFRRGTTYHAHPNTASLIHQEVAACKNGRQAEGMLDFLGKLSRETLEKIESCLLQDMLDKDTPSADKTGQVLRLVRQAMAS